ncbi:MAG TPA: hypothetical protein VFV79_01390 [Saprospiraceae bacterium]|nr:hypothetical protein [Saprospiraceae bacterium]
MNRILKDWTLPRIFYFFLGGLILVQSVLGMEWLGIIFGGYFTAMGLFGFGCAAGQCYPYRKKNVSEVKDELDFEEIKKT